MELKRLVVWIALAIYMVWVLFPIYWTINSSLKHVWEVNAIPPLWWPPKPTLKNYIWALFSERAGKSLLNSLIVSTGSTALAVFLGALAGYYFSRYKMHEGIFWWLLTTRMFPPIIFAIPIFLMFKYMGILDTHLALIIAYVAMNIPLAVWLMRGYFDEVPIEVEEAARLDGLNPFKTLWKITLPIIAPGVAATIALSWIFAWNEFLLAYILTRNIAFTYPVVLPTEVVSSQVFYNRMTAISAIALLPSRIILLLFRMHIVRMYVLR